jgi:hypothetical protein
VNIIAEIIKLRQSYFTWSDGHAIIRCVNTPPITAVAVGIQVIYLTFNGHLIAKQSGFNVVKSTPKLISNSYKSYVRWIIA